MKLEEIIYNILVNYEPLAAELTMYRGLPAVFLQEAPADTMPGWERGVSQYPRVVYTLDRQADPARKTAGTLMCSVYCDAAGTPPEPLVPVIKAALLGVICSPEDGPPCAMAWARTEAFELSTKKEADVRVVGVDLRFDLLEYPEQKTSTPDCAEALAELLWKSVPEAHVIGKERIYDFIRTTNEAPALYVRTVSYRRDYRTRFLIWMHTDITIHVICPDLAFRQAWSRYISDMLNSYYRIPLLDGSEAIIEEISVDNTADYLASGQINMTLYFSIPVQPGTTPPIRNDYFKHLKP